MGTIQKKLRGRAGETLAETLIAVLVIAVALTMLAGMITATADMVKSSEKKMGVYYSANAALETLAASDTFNVNVTVDGKALPLSVCYAANETFSNKPVIAYRLKEGTTP